MAEAESAPRLTRRGANALLLLGWALFFANALIHPSSVPYYRDHLVTNIPVRDYVRDRLLSGELPQWFPYEGLGVPIIGQIALGTFHPLNLLVTPLPAVQGEKWALLLAYLFSLIGAYKAARVMGVGRWAAVLGAWTYALGGYALGVSCIIAYAMSFAALPWVAWAATRLVQKRRVRDAAAMAACAGCVFLAGDALGLVFCAVIGALAFSAQPSRRALGLFALAGAWSVALVAIELLPATVVGADAIRNVGTPGPSMAFTWATHPLRLVELAMPGLIVESERAAMLNDFFGGGSATFATTIYFGVLGLAAIAAAVSRSLSRPGKIALGVGVFALLLALGGHLGLLGLLQRVLPMLGKFRYPERYLAFFWVSMLWVVPFGFERALSGVRRGFFIGAGLVGAVNVFFALPFAARLLWRLNERPLSDAMHAAVSTGWLESGAIGAALAIAAAGTLMMQRTNLRWAVFSALLFADLLRGNAKNLPLVSSEYFEASPFATEVRTHGRVVSIASRQWPSGVTLPGREEWVASTLARLRPTTSELSHVETLTSNLGALQRRHAMVFGGRDEQVLVRAPYFNGCFVVFDEGTNHVVMTLPALHLDLISQECWPRAFIAETEGTNAEGALHWMDQLSLDRVRVPWEGGPTLDSHEGTVTALPGSPEHRVFAVDAAAPTALVVTDDYVPGWSATVDGASVPIHPTMVTALGVELPAGKHQVELTYRTPRFVPGLVISLAGWIALLIVAAAAKRKAVRL